MKQARNGIIALIILFVSLAGSKVLSQKLSMDEAVKIAIENNPEIKAAKLNIEKEEAVKLRSFNIPRPEIFLEYEGIKGSLKNFETRKIGILQEMEFPTSYFLRSDVQGSQVNIAREELKKAEYMIKFEVENVYLNLILSFKQLEIAKDNLKIFEDFLFAAGKKYEAGSASNLEVLGAKVNKIRFENEVKSLESQISVSKSDLRRLMNSDNRVSEQYDELHFEQKVLNKERVMNSALSNNPDIKINRLQKEKFSNKMSLTRSELLPDLSFRYYKQKIGNDGDFWGIEFGIGLPLWFWWEPSGNIKEADLEYTIAEADELTVKKNIENDVNMLFEEYENGLRESLFFHDEAIPEASEILRQAKISYEEGAIGYVEYLQGLQIVYETRNQYYKSIYNYNMSILKLEKLTAGEIK